MTQDTPESTSEANERELLEVCREYALEDSTNHSRLPDGTIFEWHRDLYELKSVWVTEGEKAHTESGFHDTESESRYPDEDTAYTQEEVRIATAIKEYFDTLNEYPNNYPTIEYIIETPPSEKVGNDIIASISTNFYTEHALSRPFRSDARDEFWTLINQILSRGTVFEIEYARMNFEEGTRSHLQGVYVRLETPHPEEFTDHETRDDFLENEGIDPEFTYTASFRFTREDIPDRVLAKLERLSLNAFDRPDTYESLVELRSAWITHPESDTDTPKNRVSGMNYISHPDPGYTPIEDETDESDQSKSFLRRLLSI